MRFKLDKAPTEADGPQTFGSPPRTMRSFPIAPASTSGDKSKLFGFAPPPVLKNPGASKRKSSKDESSDGSVFLGIVLGLLLLGGMLFYGLYSRGFIAIIMAKLS